MLGFVAVTAATHQRGRRLPDHRPHAEDVQEAQRPGAKTVTIDRRDPSYLVASVLFILGSAASPRAETARRGILLAELGMLIAVVGTLLHREIVDATSGSSSPARARLGHRHAMAAADPDDQDAGANRALARVRRPGGGARRRRPSTTCTRRAIHLTHAARWARSASRCSSARSPSPAASWRSASCRASSRPHRSPTRARTRSNIGLFASAVAAPRAAHRRPGTASRCSI